MLSEDASSDEGIIKKELRDLDSKNVLVVTSGN